MGTQTGTQVRPENGLHPQASPSLVRGGSLLRRVDDALAWLDGFISRWLPHELNPLSQAGAAANLALIAAVASGVLMLLWYSPSVQFAYSSLQSIAGRSLGGWVRAVHRYSSDLAMLLLIVHAGRVFFARKFSGARWLPWVSGILMLALVWFIGWTGFWLVWDQPAQQIAVSSMRLVDALPFFGEPMGRLYVADRTVPSLLFFVVFFLHMLLPLAIAVGLAVHLARVSRARLLPRRALSWGLIAGLSLAAVLVPAPLDAPARMAEKAARFTVDAWYLSPLALGLRFQHIGLWLALGGGTLLGALVPWLLGRRRALATRKAFVNASRCHACTQCVQDCPFDAIKMVPRTDQKKFASEARVDPAKCVGCGVCAGSCDSEGMTLTWFDTRIEEARIEREVDAALAEGIRWVAFVAEDARVRDASLPGYCSARVPTASWVRPKFVEALLARGVRGVLVVRDARAEAAARDGGRWVESRLAGERTPKFRPERAGDGAWKVVDHDPSQPDSLRRAAAEFRGAGGHVRASDESGLSRGRLPQARGPVREKRDGLSPWIPVVLMGTVLLVATIAPSHLRVANPAGAAPEFVFSLRAFGDRSSAPVATDAAEEAKKPVHMRAVPGQVATTRTRREPVVVRVTIDGASEERVFAAKGLSHDGAAVGEWRRPWTAGEHAVAIEVVTGRDTPPQRWSGTLRAEERRLNVVTFESGAGFRVE